MWKMEQVGVYPAALGVMNVHSCSSSRALAYFLMCLMNKPSWLSAGCFHFNFPNEVRKSCSQSIICLLKSSGICNQANGCDSGTLSTVWVGYRTFKQDAARNLVYQPFVPGLLVIAEGVFSKSPQSQILTLATKSKVRFCSLR